MLCAVCNKLSPDLEGSVEGEVIYFHSVCATCFYCGKPATHYGVTSDNDLVFMHEECCFTPAQMETLLRLQHEYSQSQDH